ncbi:D-isomer specific 2-hydroxyacid dehydrogenase [Catenovulum agarivorans DS-2]|uniref:D-isomer specific 2-hydroxyacid dehydrogenase n=2 Tax=Catenovulum agarivorans TaxID=1172192 RepID=W7QTY4_9ALTE|nr:D-isomer specific 2-hydroxyacid dehydrogenase [Catenovulum agarivorans DS-2]
MPNKIALFSAKPYDKTYFEQFRHEFDCQVDYFEVPLTEQNVQLCQGGYDAVCVFVNDTVNQAVLSQLSEFGCNIVALRCAGFNNVDLQAAENLNIRVCRVPSYSPEAVAEHTVGLMLTLSRKFHKAYNRVKEDNFSLNGLLGFNLFKKTVGIIGTGKIGHATINILKGFGCNILAFDPTETPIDDVAYVSLETLYKQADIISLHCPLTPQTHHLINQDSLALMREGVMIVNTSRGGLIDTDAMIKGLKARKIGYLGLDVYEQEANLFFEDLSNEIIDDDVFQRLLTFPNVLITGHQGFFTQEALTAIAQTTLGNIQLLNNQQDCLNQIKPS